MKCSSIVVSHSRLTEELESPNSLRNIITLVVVLTAYIRGRRGSADA